MVKPQSLMRWLVRLICPPGGIVLDPFAGSGSTLVACISESCHFIGVDAELEYVNIANARIRHAMQEAGWETEVQEFDCHPSCPIAQIDSQSGRSKSVGGFTAGSTGGIGGKSGIYHGANGEQSNRTMTGYNDEGGASRFFTQLPPDSLFAELDEELSS